MLISSSSGKEFYRKVYSYYLKIIFIKAQNIRLRIRCLEGECHYYKNNLIVLVRGCYNIQIKC